MFVIVYALGGEALNLCRQEPRVVRHVDSFRLLAHVLDGLLAFDVCPSKDALFRMHVDTFDILARSLKQRTCHLEGECSAHLKQGSLHREWGPMLCRQIRSDTSGAEASNLRPWLVALGGSSRLVTP